MKEKAIEKGIIFKLTSYLNEVRINKETDSFRGLIGRLGLGYIEAQDMGFLDFNNALFELFEEQQKEIEERKKGYLLENKLFTETLKKQCREIDDLKKETLNKLEKMFPLDNDLKFYGYRNEIEEFKSKLKKNKTNNDLSDYQSGEI